LRSGVPDRERQLRGIDLSTQTIELPGVLRKVLSSDQATIFPSSPTVLFGGGCDGSFIGVLANPVSSVVYNVRHRLLGTTGKGLRGTGSKSQLLLPEVPRYEQSGDFHVGRPNSLPNSGKQAVGPCKLSVLAGFGCGIPYNYPPYTLLDHSEQAYHAVW
jgi:hypothetical protein